jgi:DNA-binding FadR family transcriptional regulator
MRSTNSGRAPTYRETLAALILERCSDQSDHVMLVDALRARELPPATEVMELHLGRVEMNLLGAQQLGEAG